MNKTAIKNFAVSARIMLIDAVTQRAYEYDVTENGRNDPAQDSVNGNSLTPVEKNQRSQLIQKIRLNGFTQTMEEITYTWFNRFIALRFMEVNNYLPSHIRVFTDENGDFKPEILSNAVNVEIDGLDREYVLELLEKQDNETLYKYLIITQCNALNAGLPEMFEEIGGWTELLFPANLLRSDSVIANMVSMIPESDWTEQVQIIGWLYQYYNTEPKDKVFADLKKNIKISASAIPSATQLFTPDWIVRYMVDNSLGRLWLEGHENSEIKPNLPYYLDEAEQEKSVKSELEKIRLEYKNIQPEQIKFLDPCMGSGHILVYAFDVLMQIYVSCGWSERDAAKSILRHNLYGLDIDRRAYQLAYFAVMMKARRYNRRILSSENQPNLANFADTMGVDASMIPAELKSFVEQFQFADTYGSLMSVTAPEGLTMAVSEFGGTFGMNQHQLDMMLKIYQILSQKYDVVCTNPPYMGGSGMNSILSDYVKKNFPDSKSDLFACFIEKCGNLIKENGFYAMITMQSWMFLLSFEKLRNHLMRHDVINLVHLGSNAFEQGDVGTIVQAVSFVIRNSNYGEYCGKYLNLCEEHSSEKKRISYLKMNRFYLVTKNEFYGIPSHPYAYWASKHTFELFSNKTLGSFTEPRQGMTTSDNNRFTKKWYEVAVERICFNAQNSEMAQKSRKKWFPYNKGGGYRKWYGNHEYVVNYEDDGRELKKFHEELNKTSSGGRIKNREYYFRKSIAWTFIATIPGFRYCPEGFIFDVAGSSLFVDDNLTEYVMAFLCSCVTKYFLNLLNPTMNIQANDIKSLPYIYNDTPKIKELVSENIKICETDWNAFETSWDFEQHPLI
ncbi:MAG TPA: BREX-1 system adenine-specific DNA-methyltransferase PglX [Ruminococcus sp.]|nr:BREX-1 system adenine-specific DNA-methyltransferase PglX [Ruminococcus sp.]